MINKIKKKSGEAVRANDYIYASALVRTRANSRLDREGLLRVAESRDLAEICKILPEYQIEPIYTRSGELDAEKTANEYLAGEFECVCKAMPQGAILDFLKIPYDCHNLKVAAKCEFRDRDDCEDLFIDLGRVPAGDVLQKVRVGDLSAFTENLAISFEKAKKAFAESGDPKLIDSILDSACYADMLGAVGSWRNEYFRRLVEIKIDTTNLMTAVRTLRMGDTTGLFDSMFLHGSPLGIDFFKKAMENGEESLLLAVKSKGYVIPSDEDGRISLTSLGKACEEIYIKAVGDVKSVQFGAEICVSYLIKTSHVMKILRTVVASKEAGIDSAKIKEKIGSF